MLGSFLKGALTGGNRGRQAPSQPLRGRVKLRRNLKVDVDSKLDLGERVYTFLRAGGAEQADKYEATVLHDASEGTNTAFLPYGFGGFFFTNEMRLRNTSHRRIAALRLYICSCILEPQEHRRGAQCGTGCGAVLVGNRT